MVDAGMRFELAMRLFFGDRAYQIAGTEADWRSRRAWLRRAIRLLMREVDALDTTPRHREVLIGEFDAIDRLLSNKDPSWDLIYRFLRACGRLFGFSGGAKCHSLAYWQDLDQRFTANLLSGNRGAGDDDPQNVLAIRRAIVARLEADGIDTFRIGLVLNCTEHQVKRIRAGRRPRRHRAVTARR